MLSGIDVAAAPRTRLGVGFRPYVIPGARNPPLAHRARMAGRDIGLLLRCNVIFYAWDAEGEGVAAAMDPVEALSLTGNGEIRRFAAGVKERRRRVLAGVEAG